MKTATTASLARSRMWQYAIPALLIVSFAAWPAGAKNPPPDAPDAGIASNTPAAAATVESDPYLVYLESLDSRNAACREQSLALRRLLAEREALARQFVETPATARTEIAREMEALDRQIDDAEVALETSVAASQPTDAPNVAPVPVVDLEKLRAQAQRTRRPVDLPVPHPAVIPALPAPPREALFLDYLAARAGDSTFARDLVVRVARLLHERRELAFRHSRADAIERARLETTIRAVSLQVRISSRAAAEAVEVSNW